MKINGGSMNEPSTLIIWEEVPEDTRFFLIPNAVIEQHSSLLEAITSANSHFINCCGEENVLVLQKFLFNEDGDCIKPELETQSQKEQLVFDNVLITRVCHTGFML
jgi:hypothetical protein